jgi:hypothetical protein
MGDSQLLIIVLVVLVAAVAVAAAWYLTAARRRQRLQRRFGPEYERTVRETGDPAKADAVLADRERRVEKLNIRPLSSADSTRFLDAWKGVQSRFVDDPKGAVTEADRLITEVMSARGYPMSDWEQRVADISVDHPSVCDHYRQGHDIARRHERGQASTEDLRQAMVHYRALFDELVQPADPRVEAKHERPMAHKQRRAG